VKNRVSELQSGRKEESTQHLVRPTCDLWRSWNPGRLLLLRDAVYDR
jgi:hypothetical protein